MLSDIEVCYKMFTSEVLKELRLTSDGFGIEIELSAQIALAKRWRIYEVGISFVGKGTFAPVLLTQTQTPWFSVIRSSIRVSPSAGVNTRSAGRQFPVLEATWYRGIQMVGLGGVKQHLREHYPSVYQNAHRLYQITPYAKWRNARRMAMEDEISKKMRYRAEYEARIIRDYFDDDWTVRHGPFSGMRLGPLSTDQLLATHADNGEIKVDNLINDTKLLATSVIGCYESQLHRWINDAIAYGYDRILDIGCAFGYYAVGFALKSRTSTVYAYDTDPRARENTAELARINDVAEKVHVRALCTFDELNEGVSSRTLIVCDVEGGELDLLSPDFAPALSRADLIVETHDNYRPGTTESLARRFVPSHQIEIVYHGAKYATNFPVLKAVPATEHAWLLQEGRSRDQRWMRLLANHEGAIEPGKPYFLTPSSSL